MLIRSEIRNLITEAFGDDTADLEQGAQEINVPFNTEQDSTVPPQDSVDSAVAAGFAAQPEAGTGMGGSNMQISATPGNINQSITVDKTLVNTDLIHAILGEIKALVTNAERIFDKEDLESSDAQIYIGNLINSLNTSTEKLIAFVEPNDTGAPLPSPEAAAPPMPPPEEAESVEPPAAAAAPSIGIE